MNELNERDTRTARALRALARRVVNAVESMNSPAMDIPQRSLANTKYHKARRTLEMGSATTKRELFNLSQAKSFMQTLLVASASRQLIDGSKTTSLRGMYYMLKHTIEGSKESTFDDQSESDRVIEDVEVFLGTMREDLHLYADDRGAIVGPLVMEDSGDTIDCSKMGSGGHGIPSIVEDSVIQFKECTAKFILHVEKGTVWRRFNEDKFWKKHNCILTHGGGQPPRGVRRLLHRLHNELHLPVYCLLDNDPWGYYIYSVIKQGSINLAHESKRMAIPEAKFIGVRSKDYERYGLSPGVTITLNERDIRRAKQIRSYPWFAEKQGWRREIDLMLKHGFKLEVEALISKSISYVTEKYVPDRLKDHDFLD